MNSLRNFSWQAIFPKIIRPDCKRPAVSVRNDKGLLMQDSQEPQGQEVQQPREEHALDVRDQLCLAN